MNYLNAAGILRDQKGINDKNIGFTNEKGINELIAHHSVIMEPANELMWVSTQPFQLGKFYCYDLTKVFSESNLVKGNKVIYESDKTIPEDPFLHTKDYIYYLQFVRIKNYIHYCTKSPYEFKVDQSMIDKFVSSNPENYSTYWIIGDYFKKIKDMQKAIFYYNLALTKEVATDKEANKIKELISECKKK
jgi:hypothetical protein